MWRGWARGGPGLRDRVWSGVQKLSAQLGKSRRLFPWMAHFFPCPSPRVWAEDGGLPGMDPPEHKGR